MATRGRSSADVRQTDPDRQLPPGDPDRSNGTGLTALIRSLATDLQTLVRQELELAKLEAVHTAKRLALDSAWIGAGAAIMAVGGLVLVVALALGLGVLLGSYWLGTLVTGLILMMAGAGVAWKGAKDLRSRPLVPTGTVESLKEDADWARREAREFKDEIRRSTP